MSTKDFDYVKYDDKANEHQAIFKERFIDLHESVANLIDCPRSKALVKTKLEEAYMWIGKGIRNDQIKRNGSAELEESRTNS